MRAVLLLALLLALPAGAQTSPHDDPAPDTTAFDPTGHFAVYTAAGAPTDLDAVVAAMADADAVFLGEQHDDPTAHALQRRLLEEAHRRYGSTRPIALSLEMFERDAQLVLDEYLAGLIRERDFLAASRPWSNYAPDYRPLVEYARAHGLPVIAANVPARYVSRVGREGPAALDALPEAAQALLPPRPIASPSDALATRFEEAMGGMMAAHGDNAPSLAYLLAAQNLRDATMAASIVEHLARPPAGAPPLVVHVNGAFHSEDGLGVPEHLARYAPAARVVVVTFTPSDHPGKAPDPSGDAFVVLTDRAALPAR